MTWCVQHTAVVADRALHLGEVRHAGDRQRLQVCALLLEHGLHLAAFGTVDARGCPLHFPVFQEGVLLLDTLEAPALERCGQGVADGVLYRPFAIGVSHPSRVA